MSETKYTPGALRAAEAMMAIDGSWSIKDAAEIIDRETGARALLEALEEQIKPGWTAGVWLMRDEQARAAIAAARGTE